MRRLIFLDTGYLIALIRKKDACHEAAVTASVKYAGPFVTTDLVLVELANALSQPPYRVTVVDVIEKMRADANTRIIPFNSEGMKKALTLYKGRSDKSWGLTDCFSFVVMKEEHIKLSLTFDEHFRQAGFEVPLLSR